MQDAAVAVVLDFDRRIDSAGRDEVDHRAVSLAGDDFNRLLRLQVVGQSDLEFLGAVEVQRLTAFAFAELQRQDPGSPETF